MGWMNGDVDREECLCRLSVNYACTWLGGGLIKKDKVKN